MVDCDSFILTTLVSLSEAQLYFKLALPNPSVTSLFICLKLLPGPFVYLLILLIINNKVYA